MPTIVTVLDDAEDDYGYDPNDYRLTDRIRRPADREAFLDSLFGELDDYR